MGLLLECSIRAILIAAAVAAVLRGLRIVNPAARHTAWCGVLVAMLLLPAFAAWGPKAVVPVLPAIEETPTIEPWIPPPSVESRPRAARIAEPLNAPPGDSPWRVPPASDILLPAYLAGTALLLIRLILGTLQTVSLMRRASPEQEFLTSAECACPVTVGWRRPVVILPAAWSEWPRAELEAVLTHEREHVRRRDPLVQWVSALNRCIFWFHPMAWWLEWRLATLAEDACDGAVIANGHDRREYSEYLINQARAIQRAGRRVGEVPSAAMGRGALGRRIRRLLDEGPTPAPSRTRAVVAGALCSCAIGMLTACKLDRVQKPAPGQPTMNELMHRRAAESQRFEDKRKEIEERARALTPDAERQLVDKLKQNPLEEDSHRVLVRHYELTGNIKDRYSLTLWLIEHHPDGKLWPGSIDPRLDRTAYNRGKALWLAHTQRAGASPEIFERASSYLAGGDKPLAEEVLEGGRKAYPNDARWARAFGELYAQTLCFATPQEAQSARARLSQSTDAEILAQTARHVLRCGNPFRRRDRDLGFDAVQLARTYIDRASSIAPDSASVQSTKAFVIDMERGVRARQLGRISATDRAGLNDSDRILLAYTQMRNTWIQRGPVEAAAPARELLELAKRNPNDPLYSDAVFEGNIMLGKAALRGGDRKAAARFLLAAAETPGSDQIRHGQFEMNLPRALIDRGDRDSVARFLDVMAPRTAHPKRLQDWAVEIRKGINPDLIPTFSAAGCSQDPC